MCDVRAFVHISLCVCYALLLPAGLVSPSLDVWLFFSLCANGINEMYIVNGRLV